MKRVSLANLRWLPKIFGSNEISIYKVCTIELNNDQLERLCAFVMLNLSKIQVLPLFVLMQGIYGDVF